MPRLYKPKPGYKRMFNYAEEDIEAALKAVEDGVSQRQACKRYGIPRGTLQNKLLGRHPGKHGGKTVFSVEEERAFVTHLTMLANWGFPVDFLDFRLLVKNYLIKCGRMVEKFSNNLPSNDWVRSFLRRNKSTLTLRFCQNIATKRADVSPQSITSYFDNLEVSLAGIPPANILNYDETNLCDNPGKKKCIFRRGVKYPERVLNSTKASTSIMFACTAAGQMLPPYVVYKAKHLMNTWTEGGPAKARYNRSKSGWFDAVCFSDWFQSTVVPWAKSLQGRKVVIGDNLSSHFTEESLKACADNNISFVCLPANSTHLCQPLDVSVFSSLKTNWRAVLTEWKQGPGRRMPTLSKDSFPKLLHKLMEKLQPVIATNCVSGFRRTGICPVDRRKVLGQLPPEIQDGTEYIVNVSTVFIDSLKELRYDQGAPKQRRKRVSVEPGKSIALEDIQANGDDNTEEDADVVSNMSEDATPASDIDSDDSMSVDELAMEPGKWVVVKYQVRNRALHYIGQLLQEIEDSSSEESTAASGESSRRWEVKFLRKSTKSSAFVPPRLEDIAVVTANEIVQMLPNPTISKRLHHQFPLLFDGYNLQ